MKKRLTLHIEVSAFLIMRGGERIQIYELLLQDLI